MWWFFVSPAQKNRMNFVLPVRQDTDFSFFYRQEALFIGEFRKTTSSIAWPFQIYAFLTRPAIAATFFKYDLWGESGLKVPAWIRWLASSTTEDSAMLNCALHTEICDEDYGVCSFRTSGESRPGLIDAAGGRNTNNNTTKTCCYDF